MVRLILLYFMLIFPFHVYCEDVNLPSEDSKLVVGSVNDSLPTTETEDDLPFRTNFKNKTVWENPDFESPYLDLAPITYSNRAGCADDSKSATRSAYVVIDTLNVAKMGWRLALDTNKDPKYLTTEIVHRYKYAVLKLLDNLAMKLLEGKLPLLPSDITDGDVPKRYNEISARCPLDGYCKELDQYIGEVWENSVGKNPGNVFKVDDFDPANSFINSSTVKDKFDDVRTGCYYLKKHSELQGHLDTVKKPDVTSLKKLMDSHVKQDEYLAACDDFAVQSSLENGAFLFEIVGVKEKRWQKNDSKYGFDFWNSLKLYASWAFRLSPEIGAFQYPFANVFRSVHFEDTLMLFSNGCKSITKPKCENSHLTEQKIRDFAQYDFDRNMSAFDETKYVADGVTSELIEKPLPSVNQDELDFNQFPSMDEWVKNFRKNMVRTRGMMKGRILDAINTLELTKNYLSISDIISSLKSLKQSVDNWPRVAGENFDEFHVKNQFYYLCSEYLIASDSTLGVLKNDLERVKDLKTLAHVTRDLTTESVASMFDYYEELATQVRGFCSELEAEGFWGSNFQELEKSGFKPWYTEFYYKNSVTANISERRGILEATPLFVHEKFSRTNNAKDIICFDGVDCSRKILESIVNMYTATMYAKTYFSSQKEISAVNMANPYAERVACKVYDPWWKTKKAFFNLITDVSMAAISAVNPTPFYLAADILPKKVTSFNEMLEDGTLKLDPKWDRQRLVGAIGADFGSLLGIPCMVTLSNTKGGIGHLNKYYFAGVSIDACVDHTGSKVIAMSAGDVNVTPEKSVSGCVSCTLNFSNAINIYAVISQVPVLNSAVYLFRGVLRFFKALRDPINVPRKYVVDINSVVEAHRKNGEIEDDCVSKLRSGKHCMDYSYEKTYADFFQRYYKMAINRIDKYPGGAFIYLNGCSEPVRYDQGLWSGPKEKINQQGLIPSSCKLEKKKGIRSEVK